MLLEGDDAKEVLFNAWECALDVKSSWANGDESLIIYMQNTADNYEVYICTDDHNNNLSWDHDVYYYEAHEDWMERVIDELRHGGSVWIDEVIWEDMEYEAQNAWRYAYEDWFSGMFDDKKDELLDKGNYEDYKD